MRNRAGAFKKNLTGEAAYKSFVPASLPPAPPLKMGGALVAALVEAGRRLARLDALASRIPDLKQFIAMYVRKEALMSSQIEGTQATLEDVLDPLSGANANRDVADVVNCVKATEFAIRRLAELPLCNRLIRETHAVLMAGVRGRHECPGEFRRSQNWIGGQGSAINNARYIPPNAEDMAEAMGDLEAYMNGDDGSDVLVRAALVHYQFETIHPFLDGNGRVGRLLITLFLMAKGALATPALYVSYFLKKNRVEYYDRLGEVRRTGDYEQWVAFFLEAVAESAADAIATIDKLTALHDKNVALIGAFGQGAPSALKLLTYLEANPIMEIGKTAEALGLAYGTVAAATRRLARAGILAQTAGRNRGRVFSYEGYLGLLRAGT